ncbi:hypothetical protein [Salinibacter altiplanensis]|uniref:hypothetical protein n=1 Tax=Salinibacter altiplanensis TaxID=1803181 RepID=UPI000C9F5EA3|nr:hypothetical protein [Salinibacter altiplanensis]
METTTDDLNSTRITAVDESGTVARHLDDLQSALWGLEEHLKDVPGPFAEELRVMLHFLQSTKESAEEVHEAAQTLHKAAK